MAAITAQMVKELRESTSAGMMDCKKALTETNGNMEEAVDWLRKKGLSSAAKKSSRVASEGLVSVSVSGTSAVALEVNAETDFVARNDQFQSFVSKASALALSSNAADIEALKTQDMGGKTVEATLTDLIATIGENMNLRRMTAVSVNDGVVVPYIHNAIAEGLGKIAVLVALESTGDKAALEACAKQIAMHVAAARPEFLSVDAVDADALNRERNVLSEQARASGKPEEIIEKMVEGRIRKYYEEVVLLEQVFVIDGETKIKDVVAKCAKELGTDVALTSFVRMQLGEGIEKEAEDFAAEVAKAAGM